MVGYLRSAGRTRIATITGPLDISGGRGRLEGYRDVVGAAFDESLTEEGDYSQGSGESAMTSLLQRLLLAAIGGEQPLGGDLAYRARAPGERVTRVTTKYGS
jgi:DNA-binding LacI/PurR family transcriptional regulator